MHPAGLQAVRQAVGTGTGDPGRKQHHGSGQGAKKKAQVFAALRGALPDWLKPFITDEVLDSVIEKAVGMMKKALAEKKPTINKE